MPKHCIYFHAFSQNTISISQPTWDVDVGNHLKKIGMVRFIFSYFFKFYSFLYWSSVSKLFEALLSGGGGIVFLTNDFLIHLFFTYDFGLQAYSLGISDDLINF